MEKIEQISAGCYVKGDYAAVTVETQTGDWKWAVIGPKSNVEVLALYIYREDALEDLKQRIPVQ